jgi:hypothetical protein
MTIQLRSLPVAVCVTILVCIPAIAQTQERYPATSTSQTQEQSPKLPPNATPTDVVAHEMGLLRKSLQTLNARLREISDKLPGASAGQSGPLNDKQNGIALNLDVLSRAEQRAEGLRRLLIELIEKETMLRSRLVQIEEDMRPESIERAVTLMGSTRTAEMRDVRRRVLENDRRGFESLLGQTAQNRIRLEDDVKGSDALVSRLRQRLLPLIEKEVEKLTPN